MTLYPLRAVGAYLRRKTKGCTALQAVTGYLFIAVKLRRYKARTIIRYTIYMKAKNNIYVNASGNVKVEAVTPEKVEKDKTVSVLQTASWYEFTAPAAGDYRFKLEKGLTNAVKFYKGSDGINGQGLDKLARLEKDEKLYIFVQKPDMQAEFKIIEKQPVPIVDGTDKYDAEKDDTTIFTLTPKDDMAYTFTASGSYIYAGR